MVVYSAWLVVCYTLGLTPNMLHGVVTGLSWSTRLAQNQTPALVQALILSALSAALSINDHILYWFGEGAFLLSCHHYWEDVGTFLVGAWKSREEGCVDQAR